MDFILWTFFLVVICHSYHGVDGIIGKFITDVISSSFSTSFTALICSDADTLLNLSKQASAFPMMHQFIYLRKDLNLDKFHFASQTYHQHFYVLNVDCPYAINFLLKANARKMFVAPKKWFIYSESNHTAKIISYKNNSTDSFIKDKLTNVINQLEIYPDSEVYVSEASEENFMPVLSIYRPNIDKDMIFEKIGNWSSRDGLQNNYSVPISRRRQNLQKINLKTCLVMVDPDTLNHLTDFENIKVDGVTKANYLWIQHLVNRMNATMTFTWKNTWGYKSENGTWNGMIGLIERGEIDFGGTATFLIPQRLEVIDYIQLYTPVCSRFIFKKPPLSYMKNLFALPFDRIVWYVIAFILCILCVILQLVLKWEWRRMIESIVPSFISQLKIRPTISDNVLIILGIIFQQGASYEPRNISSRIVILMLLILSLSLYASYTANIVALLQSTASTINTIQDLMNSGLKIGVYDIVYNRYYFQAMQDPSRKKFYRTFVENKTSVWMSLEEGIERIRKGLFAFHVDATAGYSLMQETYEEEEKCGLHEIDYLNVLYPMLVLPRDSPYREIFRVGALWIRESGLQQRDNHRLFTRKPVCVGQKSFISVGLIDCYAAFLMMSYGMIVAIGLLFLEKIYCKWCNMIL